MMERMKRVRLKWILRMGFCLALIAAMVLIGAVMASAEVYSGECGAQGDNVTWTLDTETGVFELLGHGEMENHEDIWSVPWLSCRGMIKSVFVGKDVTSIGDHAFWGSGVKTVTFEDGSKLAYIGNSAFSSSGIVEINIPYEVKKIGDRAFADTPIKNIFFEEGCLLSHIDTRAFLSCTKLISITIPANVTLIDEYAFQSCKQLKNLSFEENSKLEIINACAFRYCMELSAVTLPQSVEFIDIFAFSGCSSLSKVVFEDNSALQTIGREAFSNCSYLRKVDFGNNSQLRNIGEKAFYSCSRLNSVNFQASQKLTDIGELAFGACGLTSIEFSSINPNIGKNAFGACNNLTTVLFADSDNWFTIGEGAFVNCKRLSNVNLIQCRGLTDIPANLFTNCALTGIYIPMNVKTIHNTAFNSCSEVEVIEVAQENSVFHSSGNCLILTHEQRLLLGCNYSQIPDDRSVSIIDDYAFYNCDSLIYVRIPDGVTTIGKYAYYGCVSLTSINLPETIHTIGNYAFQGDDSLYVVINNSNIPLDFGSNDYGYITKNAIIIDKNGERVFRGDEEKEYHITDDGFVFYTLDGEHTLFAYIGGNRDVVLPLDYEGNKYRVIKIRGINNCTIPNGQIELPGTAFSGCKSVRNVNILLKITNGGIFGGCTNLISVSFPESLNRIYDDSFDTCKKLKKLYFKNRYGWYQDGYYGGELFINANGDNVYSIVHRDGDSPNYVMHTYCRTVEFKITFVADGKTVATVPYWNTDHNIEIPAVPHKPGYTGVWEDFDLTNGGDITVHAIYTPIESKLTSASLSIGQSLALNYYATLNPAHTAAVMRFTYHGETITVNGVLDETTGEYKFTLGRIPPQCMGDNVKAELILIAEDGTETVLDVKESYSIRRYCDDALAANPDNEALTTLLADLLAYGDAAQDYANYNEDTPVSAGFEAAPSEWQAVTETDFALSDKTREELCFTAAGVRFGYVNRIYFKIKAADLTGVTVTVNGKTYTAEDLEPVENADGTYILYTDAVYATEFDKIFTAELTVDGEVIQTVTYSVKSYVFAKQNGNDDMAALAKALYNYGRSALAYKNAQ